VSDLPTQDDAGIADRKLDHLTLCAAEDVESRGKTTLLEDVELLHDALPELSAEAIDLSAELTGRPLSAPLVITGMTGGVDRATEINRALARSAQRHGIAFGLGSQRAMLEARLDRPPPGYDVRGVAPEVVLLGNLGAVQAARASTEAVAQLVAATGADALCLHLNPGQEMIQPEGDRDFCGCLDGIARLVDELPVPVVVKETGCGLGPATLAKLATTGVGWVDTSGAGGTTWVGVEALRADADRATVGQTLWDWGVPTAVSAVLATRKGFRTIVSGGLRDGLDVARALALGAHAAGMALPFLRAVVSGGEAAVDQAIEQVLVTLRTVMLLTGSRDLNALRAAPRVLGPRLTHWLEQLGPPANP
jgi:isopentenyl-diphosphate delta-isomerase